MRRSDRELTDPRALSDVLTRAQVLHLGMCDGGEPYVLPLSFGYVPGPEDGPAGGLLYIHSAREGRKIGILGKESLVAFCAEVDVEVEGGPEACDWTARYRSVVGTGSARIVDDPGEKSRALSIIVGHYAGALPQVPVAQLSGVTVLRVDIDSASGKASVRD
jgi:uncharacterized protein